jgi:hypothetical protein
MYQLRAKINPLNIFFVVLLLGYLFSQWPFLIADADSSMAYGRGSWTDEGLNTCQIRNFVNHGHFNLLDCDNLLKTPLFSAFLYPFFKIFGISLLKARLITTLFCISLLTSFLYNKLSTYIGNVFLLSTMCFLPIHQYSHLCLAEMYAGLIIVFTGLFYAFHITKKNKQKLSYLILLMSLSVLFKLQFIYILGIPFLIHSISFFADKTSFKKRELINLLIYLGLILIVFCLVWYLPFKEEWKQIAKQQSGGFSFSELTITLIWDNLQLYFLSRSYLPYTSLFLLSFAVAIYHFFYKKYSLQYRSLILFGSCWFIVEVHKLGLSYLPIRYMISFYLSMGFVFSIVLGNYLNELKRYYKLFAWLSLTSIFALNTYKYTIAYQSRSFTVAQANSYLLSRTKKKDVIIGPWSPTLTWESEAYSFPIWTNFLGKRKITDYYHPNFIISEFNQEDSGFAYEKNNIDLKKVTDSLTQLKVVFWDLNIYKVKKQ